MGNKKSIIVEHSCMESKRPFNSNPNSSTGNQGPDGKTFTSDLFFKVGTRVALITAVYERVTSDRPSLPVPPSIRENNCYEDSDGYVVPKTIMKK